MTSPPLVSVWAGAGGQMLIQGEMGRSGRPEATRVAGNGERGCRGRKRCEGRSAESSFRARARARARAAAAIATCVPCPHYIVLNSKIKVSFPLVWEKNILLESSTYSMLHILYSKCIPVNPKQSKFSKLLLTFHHFALKIISFITWP